MHRAVRIGIVGDFDSTRPTHVATDAAITHAATALAVSVETCWLGTEVLCSDETAVHTCDALVIAPGSPYRSLQGALHAIQWAREGNVPLLGTCGGFQHVIIEYARNVLGVAGAGHAEYEPDAVDLVVTPLECSLSGQRSVVELKPGSLARTIYGTSAVEEEYRCNFGLSPRYQPTLEARGLRIVGTDRAGAARVAELPTHRFFIATLYVPQLSSQPGRPHPLLSALVAAAESHTMAGALPL
jgi:CTP synthase (UTP-ammonia lyase)